MSVETAGLSAEWVYGQLRLVASSVLLLLGLVMIESYHRQREIRGATARVGWAEDRLRRLEDEEAKRVHEAAKPAARPAAKKAAAGKAAA